MTHNQISYWTLQETKRHNLVYEAETERHNRQTESLGWANWQLAGDQLAELNRSNLVNEQIKRDQLAEQERSNRMNETQKKQQLSIEAWKVAEAERHNRADEEEKQRHNEVEENIQGMQSQIQNFVSTVNTANNLVNTVLRAADIFYPGD